VSGSRVVVAGLRFAEGPRWRDSALWYSDMHAGEVRRWEPETGVDELVLAIDGQTSGLGWDRDGRLLVVSMLDRRLLRADADGSLTELADLSGMATFHCNDMVVDGQGRAYIGNFGFDYLAGATATPATMAVVEPDGSMRAAADDLMFPNGSVITADGATLIVGETFGARMTAFDIAEDGSLSGRRLWAQLPTGAVPDGCCLDAEGAVWVASPTSNDVIRLAEGGEVLERIGTSRPAYACMLGGEDGCTLFVCTADSADPQITATSRTARIEAVTVGVPHAGRP
jgi:sugar lactone lactonase YvrE